MAWVRHAELTEAFESRSPAWPRIRPKSAVRQLMGVAWATVGRIVTQGVAERGAAVDPLNGVRHIGINEISYRKGQRVT